MYFYVPSSCGSVTVPSTFRYLIVSNRRRSLSVPVDGEISVYPADTVLSPIDVDLSVPVDGELSLYPADTVLAPIDVDLSVYQ